MNENILQALEKELDQHRIVFWYDRDAEMRDEFTGLSLVDVEKVEIDNNEFALKYRMLRQEPERKFLLYRAGPAPEDIDNWLLDVELSHAVFYADQVAIWLNEIGLGSEYADFIREHSAFFKAEKRRKSFKRKIKPSDRPERLRLVMLAICSVADARLDVILESLLSDLAFSRDEKSKLIERCNLKEFLWSEIAHFYDYHSESPGLKDFIIELFCRVDDTMESVRSLGKKNSDPDFPLPHRMIKHTIPPYHTDLNERPSGR